MNEAILDVLSRRYGNLDTGMVEQVHDVGEEPLLRQLRRLAGASRNLDEFRLGLEFARGASLVTA